MESNENTFYNFLSDEDKVEYNKLKDQLNNPENRYNRNKRLSTFKNMIEDIRVFCEKGNADDWKRKLVCGICWTEGEIAINTRQLRKLLGKSKSSINGAMAKMGYKTVHVKSNEICGVYEGIPYLKSNFNESRQWTTRKLSSSDNSHKFTPSTPQKQPLIETSQPIRTSIVSQEAPSAITSIGYQLSFDDFNFDSSFDRMDTEDMWPLDYKYTDAFKDDSDNFADYL